MTNNGFRKDFGQTVRKNFSTLFTFQWRVCYHFSYGLTFVEKVIDTAASYLLVVVFPLVVLLQKGWFCKDVKNVKFCFLSREV